MNDKKSVIIKDSETVRNIFIQVDLKGNKTSVLSSFSPWENLAFIMEALAVTAKQCIAEGMNKDQVYGEIREYLMQVLGNYEVIV